MSGPAGMHGLQKLDYVTIENHMGLVAGPVSCTYMPACIRATCAGRWPVQFVALHIRTLHHDFLSSSQ
jgi:hypothetical protein